MAGNDDAWALAPKRSLAELVAERVIEAMRTGMLRPGERIVEATLAAKLGVSRGPLREALKALEANHLVESRRNQGTYVAQISPAQAWQMVTIRAVLEGLAARLVAAKRNPEALRALESQHQRICDSAAAGRMKEWRDEDWQFHELVCRAADNEFLLQSWQSIGNLVRLFLYNAPAFELQPEDVLGNHEDMIAALRSGDPDAADFTFRSIILRSGMRRLGLQTPPEFASLLNEGPVTVPPPGAPARPRARQKVRA
jgi:DNA-binding GntR family transcriptional regulator